MKNEKFVEDDPRAIKVIRTGPWKMDKSSTSEHYKCKTGEVIEGRNFCSGSPEEKLYNIVKKGRAAGDSLEKMISDAESDKDITGKYKSVVVAVMEENGKQNDPDGSEAKKMAENRKRAEEEEAAKKPIPETDAQKQARAEKEYYEAKHQRTLDENRAKAEKKFGKEAVKVVDDYTNQDYSSINRYLRGGEVRDEDLSRVKHEVEVLDKLTSKGFDTSVLGVQSTWPKPISSLYRGLSDDNLFEQLKSHYGEEAFKLAADKYDNSGFEKVIQEKGPYIYEDKAFMSTSSSLVAPEVYMNAEKPAESNFAFSIEVPHGVKMPGYETISYRDRDAEVILPRGTKLELVSVSKVRSYIDENFNYYKVNARISGMKTKKISSKEKT